MKKLSILVLITFCLGQSLFSQTQSDVTTENGIDKHLYFGIGFGIGFFNPGDVNDYIINNTSHLLIAGVEEIFATRYLLIYFKRMSL